MNNEYYNPDTSNITYKTFGNDDDYKDYRGRGGFLKAVTEATQRDKEEDKRMEKAKKAFSLADTFRNSSFKISDDTTVMPGYTDPGFEYTIPGRKGFGDIIGAGVGAVAGSFIPGVGPMMGANLGRNIGGRF
mgnify:CR=1 FL=1